MNNADKEFEEEKSIEKGKDQDFEEEKSIENNELLSTEQKVQDTEEYPNDTTNLEDNLNQNVIADELMGDDLLSRDVQDSTTTQEDPNVLANTDITYCKCITDQINNSKNDEPNPDNNDEDISTTEAIEKSYEESKPDEEEEIGVSSDAAPDEDEKEPEKTSATADYKQEGLLISRIFC